MCVALCAPPVLLTMIYLAQLMFCGVWWYGWAAAGCPPACCCCGIGGGGGGGGGPHTLHGERALGQVAGGRPVHFLVVDNNSIQYRPILLLPMKQCCGSEQLCLDLDPTKRSGSGFVKTLIFYFFLKIFIQNTGICFDKMRIVSFIYNFILFSIFGFIFKNYNISKTIYLIYWFIFHFVTFFGRIRIRTIWPDQDGSGSLPQRN